VTQGLQRRSRRHGQAPHTPSHGSHGFRSKKTHPVPAFPCLKEIERTGLIPSPHPPQLGSRAWIPSLHFQVPYGSDQTLLE
jgi:hypothetical protein